MEYISNFFTKAFLLNLVSGGVRLILIAVIALIGLKLVKYLISLWRTHLEKKMKLQELAHIEQKKRLDTLTALASAGLKLILLGVALLMALETIGINIAPILASAGILGLAIGFGSQNLVQDVISGFFMLLEDQVRRGDIAVINGVGGEVEHIGFRTIIIRDIEGAVHVFRNGEVKTLANKTKGWSAAVFDIGVAYKENIEHVIEVMKRTFEDLKNDPNFKMMIIKDIEVFGLENFADSSLVIKGRIKTLPVKQWDVSREYKKRLKEAFDKEGIDIPFPSRTLYLGDASKMVEVFQKRQ